MKLEYDNCIMTTNGGNGRCGGFGGGRNSVVVSDVSEDGNGGFGDCGGAGGGENNVCDGDFKRWFRWWFPRFRRR
ncbi:hypothetical protein P8452_24940 [Trifolium repens]|nr:hypothetical protein P8452_24940 [Trifolium repens]